MRQTADGRRALLRLLTKRPLRHCITNQSENNNNDILTDGTNVNWSAHPQEHADPDALFGALFGNHGPEVTPRSEQRLLLVCVIQRLLVGWSFEGSESDCWQCTGEYD